MKEASSPDPALRGLVRWFEEQPDGRERFAWVLRDSLDELIDGQRTRRWCYQQLNKARASATRWKSGGKASGDPVFVDVVADRLQVADQ